MLKRILILSLLATASHADVTITRGTSAFVVKQANTAAVAYGSQPTCEAAAQARTTQPGQPLRSFTLLSGAGATLTTLTSAELCFADAERRLREQARTTTSGTNRFICRTVTKYSTVATAPRCETSIYVRGAFDTRPVACPAAPASQTRQCPQGTTGTWQSTATVGPAPTCAITWSSAPKSTECPPVPSTDGTADLSWQAPTRNTDGTSLSNLAGYRISYGASPTALVRTIQVANPGTTRYTVRNLSPGTWYFAVRAYTSTGTESDSSNVRSKVVL